MTAPRHTLPLAAAVLAVAALDGGVRWVQRPPAAEILPEVPPFDAAAATSIRIAGGTEDVQLSRDGDGWRLTAPLDRPADAAEVEALLAELAAGVRAELRVDDDASDHTRYGLAGGDERALEVTGAEPLLSLTVGHDAGGGATWVRWPATRKVYRARIGGRARLDRPAAAWFDRTLLHVDPAQVVGLRIDGVVDAIRDSDGWAGADGAPLDAPTVARVVEELAQLRGADVVPPDRPIVWDGPTVVLTAGEPVALTLGHAGGAWVGRAGGSVDGEVWRLAAPWLDGLRHDATFRDRTLWAGGPVTRLEVRGPGLDGVLAREGQGYTVLRPGNVDVDPARAAAVVQRLAAPRVTAWAPIAPDRAGFPSDHRWTVTAGDAVHVLSIGAADGDAVWVRDEARPTEIGRLDARTVRAVEGLFGG